MGRFVSVDPFAGKYPDWSPYVYTLNNPLKYLDLYGLWADPVSNPTYRGRYGSGWDPSKSKFGMVRAGGKRMHRGVDITARKGTSLKAVVSGTVVSSSATDSRSGTIVVIRGKVNGKTYEFHYMHLDSRNVERGEDVTEGAEIGTSGESGNAEGLSEEEQHLHFQVKDENGNWVDPATLMTIKTPKKEDKKVDKAAKD